MPIILTTTPDVVESEPEISQLLADKNGKPTLEAQVIQDFLDEVDFDDLFDVEEIKEFIEKEVSLAKVVGEDYEEVSTDAALIEKFKKGENPFKKKAKKDDEESDDEEAGETDDEEDAEDAEESIEAVERETLAGSTVAEFIDEDDLLGMFVHYLAEMPTETLEQKARRAVWEKYLGEGALDEFQKGAFRKIAKTPAGHMAVRGMMLAMLHKQAIKRNKAQPVGTGSASTAGGVSTGGYKGGGYMKATGYSPGTKPGFQKVRKYKKGKGAKLKAQSKKVQSKVGRVLKAVAKGGDKKGAAATVAARTGKAKGKKSLVAGAETPPANITEAQEQGYNPNRLMEGSRLSGAILNKMNGSSILIESKKPDEKK